MDRMETETAKDDATEKSEAQHVMDFNDRLTVIRQLTREVRRDTREGEMAEARFKQCQLVEACGTAVRQLGINMQQSLKRRKRGDGSS